MKNRLNSKKRLNQTQSQVSKIPSTVASATSTLTHNENSNLSQRPQPELATTTTLKDNKDKTQMNGLDDVGEFTKVQKDLLWGMYQDVRNHARHCEMLRSSAVNYMLLIASALIAVITLDKQVDRYDLPLCVIVSFIGLITALFSASYAELYYRNRKRADPILRRLDTSFFEDRSPSTLFQLLAEADNIHRKTWIYRWTRRITGSTHLFWILLPLAVCAIGVVLTVLALRTP